MIDDNFNDPMNQVLAGDDKQLEKFIAGLKKNYQYIFNTME